MISNDQTFTNGLFSSTTQRIYIRPKITILSLVRIEPTGARSKRRWTMEAQRHITVGHTKQLPMFSVYVAIATHMTPLFVA